MKKQKRNPAEILGEMRRAKMGMAVGSQLEGGGIVFGRTPKELNAKAKDLKLKAKNLKENVVPRLIDEGRNRKANRKDFKANRLLTRADKLESKAVKKGG